MVFPSYSSPYISPSSFVSNILAGISARVHLVFRTTLGAHSCQIVAFVTIVGAGNANVLTIVEKRVSALDQINALVRLRV